MKIESSAFCDISEDHIPPLNEYQLGIHSELEEIFNFACDSSQLRYVFTRKWIDRVKSVVTNWGPKKQFSDGGYNLYRIVSMLHNTLSTSELDRRLSVVENVAREQDRLRPYKKTRSELCSLQNNQILASIFEITLLSRIIENFANVKLFPKIGGKDEDVEASVFYGNREIFVEAKAIGYSEYDPKRGVGAHSIESMKRQVREAISGKLEKNKQLGLLASQHPTVLCLALGFNADFASAGWAISDFMDATTSNVALVAVFSSAFCGRINIYPNPSSTLCLSEEDLAQFKLLASDP